MTENTAEKVQRLFQTTDGVTRWYAEFESLDKEEALPILLEILNDTTETPRNRTQAANLLGMLQDPRAIDSLIEALVDPERLLRARAALALAQIGNPEERVIKAVVERLEDDDYFVRECCAKALGLMKRSEALPALEHMKETDSEWTNREVAEKSIEAIQSEI